MLQALSKENIFSKRMDTLHGFQPDRGSLYLKHDVEARIDRAVRMARIEAEEGHCATYYVQGDLLESKGADAQLQEIAGLGHEVSFHYDVLDSNEGDYNAAQAEFAQYCARFTALGNKVTTVCPHGNPTKSRDGWNSNKDFFRSVKVRERYPDMIDIVVDFPSLFPQGRYLSDAGRVLRAIGSISSNDLSNETAMDDGEAIEWEDLAGLVERHCGVVMSIHPHRFYENELAHKGELMAFNALKSAYLKLKHIPIVQSAANRFYKLARKF
ncbi:hypothetical protein ACXYL9_02070 [Qipengyuania sp. CAU 1752]